jgi:hypothetical protein
MKKRVVAVLLLVAGTANASQWVMLSRGTGGSVEYETTTLRRHGTHVLVWSRITYNQPQSGAGASYDQFMTRADFDCATDTMGLRGGSNLLKGKTVYTSTLQTDGDLIEPDSIYYHVEQAVCKR